MDFGCEKNWRQIKRIVRNRPVAVVTDRFHLHAFLIFSYWQNRIVYTGNMYMMFVTFTIEYITQWLKSNWVSKHGIRSLKHWMNDRAMPAKENSTYGMNQNFDQYLAFIYNSSVTTNRNLFLMLWCVQYKDLNIEVIAYYCISFTISQCQKCFLWQC